MEGRAKGYGIKILKDGTTFEGQWADSKFVKGKCQYAQSANNPSGKAREQLYDGEWNDGKPDGEGTKLWSDGRKYTGTWYQGKPVGEGLKTYSDGTTKHGRWEAGLFVTLNSEADPN